MVRTPLLSFVVGATASILIALGVVIQTSARADEGQVSRTYTGHIVSGTGAYRGTVGAVAVLADSRLVKFASHGFFGGDEFAVSITLHGAGCRVRAVRHRRKRCVALSGTVAGTAVGEPYLPDMPPFNRLASLSGQVSPLGAVTAYGRMGGTGYIPKGHRSLFVVLAGAHGTISLGGTGPAIPGFQEP